jgi:hypothetical protein
LTAAELPVICVETRHMKALLRAQQINKTDRNDARGIAQMMRVGLFKPVHVKRERRIGHHQPALAAGAKIGPGDDVLPKECKAVGVETRAGGPATGPTLRTARRSRPSR